VLHPDNSNPKPQLETPEESRLVWRLMGCGCGVGGLGRQQDLGVRVDGLGIRVWGEGFREAFPPFRGIERDTGCCE